MALNLPYLMKHGIEPPGEEAAGEDGKDGGGA
jgi:hypothetical protein